jgi:prevent-host-death family protein
MAKVTAFEAKTRFGELLERVAKGEEVVIPGTTSRWRG